MGHFPLQNGDYVKIALPPTADLEWDISTRSAAAACFRGSSLNDVSIWHHTTGLDVDYETLLPLEHPGATDDVVMMQTSPPASSGPYEFDPEQEWRNALYPKWQARSISPAWGQHLPKVAVFYLDHHKIFRMDAYRVVELPPDFSLWETLILQAWHDHVQAGSARIDLVYPDPLTMDPVFAAFLIVTQNQDPTKTSVMMSVYDREVNAWHETHFALVVPRLTMKAHIIEIAELYRLCSPRGPQECTLTHGDYAFADNEILPTQMGEGLALEIHRGGQDRNLETSPLEEHETVSFLQGELQAHFQRLSQMLELGAYHNWLQACSLEDTIPLDFWGSSSAMLPLTAEACLEDSPPDASFFLQLRSAGVILHHSEDDPAQRVRQHVAHVQRLEAAERQAFLWQLPPVFHQLTELLHLAAARDPFHQGHFGILTWYLSHAHSRRCNLPRLVQLEDHPATWREAILHMWRDQLYPDSAAEFYLVFPEPYELEQAVAAHLLVVQHENDDDVAALLTLYDNAVFAGRAIRFAFSSPRLVMHQTLVNEADRRVVCPWSDVQCQSWLGWDSLNHHPFVLADNGYGSTLSVQRQLHRQVLSLQDLLPQEDDLRENNHTTGIVFLVAGYFLEFLPQHLEVALPFTHASIQEDLLAWGLHCKVFLFGDHDKALCYDEKYQPLPDCVHYMYINQDTSDAAGAFLHTSSSPMEELDHMQFLFHCGCPKAVVRNIVKLMEGLFRIEFSCLEGLMNQPPYRIKRPKPWPQQCTCTSPP